MKKSTICVLCMIVFIILMIHRFLIDNELAAWIDLAIGFNFFVGYLITSELEKQS